MNNMRGQTTERNGDEMIPQADHIYRHFKGKLYRIVTIAEHSETGEQMVVYQALYGEYKVYTRPLVMFMEPVDTVKYPDADQKMRFEPVEEMVFLDKQKQENEESSQKQSADIQRKVSTTPAEPGIDPLLEAYLDTDSYRERLNILHCLHHRITDNMINTMAVVMDLEIPEGDIETRYEALHSCLMTREKYECNRLG